MLRFTSSQIVPRRFLSSSASSFFDFFSFGASWASSFFRPAHHEHSSYHFCIPHLLISTRQFHHHHQHHHHNSNHSSINRDAHNKTPEEKRQLYSDRVLHQVVSNLSQIRSHPAFQSLSQTRGHRGNNKNNNNNSNNSSGKNSREQHLFDWRHKFGSEVPRLTDAHFEAMSVPDMLMLLQLATTLAPVSGSSHVASGVSAALVRKLKEMNNNNTSSSSNSTSGVGKLTPALETVIRLLKMRKNSAGGRNHKRRSNSDAAGMNERSLSFCVAMLTENLSLHFSSQNEMRRHHDQALKNAAAAASSSSPSSAAKKREDAVSFSDDTALLRRVLLGFVSCFNDQSCASLFNESRLSDLVKQLLFATAFTAPKLQDHRQPLAPIISVLAMSLCRLRLFDESVVGFFKWAAPICIAEVDLLSGPQLSFIMEAFSNIGYHHQGLFIALGQKAGELGEMLREDEVARVLNALSRTGIEHENLRSSLESSMRMKTIHKRTSHTTTLF